MSGLTPKLLQDIDCMPLNPLEGMPALLAGNLVTVDKFFENLNELTMNGRAKDQKLEGCMKFSPSDDLERLDVPGHVSPSAHPKSNLLKQAKVSSIWLYSYFQSAYLRIMSVTLHIDTLIVTT